MTIGAKVALSVILFGGIGTLIYLKVSQAKAAAPVTPAPGKDSTAPAAPSASAPATPAPAVVPPPPPAPPDPRVGKTGSAAFAGVSVFNANGTLYKTAAAGEWIGTISSVKNGRVYLEGDSRYVFDTANPSLTTNFSGFAGIRVRRKRFNEQV